ncbi:MAG TPA: M48 family metalloprotease [Vicinamibacterales bacterium]|jgi:Zn-dependent protease with chaperone function
MARARTAVALLALTVFISAVVVSGQTQIKLPKNKYTPEQDVQIGLKAAGEVRQQYPIITDEAISVYLTKLGDRLVAVAPPELNQKVYQYSFTPVNLMDINAFALPGGPMFVQRGMFDAAASEGEVVGVMAHELSHVLLRHGTANATKAENPWLQIGQLAGAIGGAVVGGAAGSAIAQGSQFGLGTLMLRYSRDFEKQADLLGSQLMAKAGYDPRSLAHMFETIAKESGGERDPQWLSSHPDPGNRTAYITKEAESLTIATAADMSGFTTIKTKFAAIPPPQKNNPRNAAGNAMDSRSGASGPTVGTPGQPVAAPSGQYRQVNGGVFQASVPGDWTPMKGNRSVRFVPQNGYGELNGQTVFTHGVEFGLVQPSSRDLQQATNAWLNAVAESNPDLRKNGDQRLFQISQRSAIGTPLANSSPLGGVEFVNVYTTFLVDGTLFYYLTLVPEADAQKLLPAFRQIAQSIRLTDAR